MSSKPAPRGVPFARLLAIAVLGWMAGASLLIAAPRNAAPRNVVLFVTDDQSPDAGCYGNAVIQTPNLDRLAKDGIRFDRAFCTTASCSASRSVILSGLFNHANGQYGHAHSYHHFRSYEHLQTLPVILGRAGYRTAQIGKFHVAPEEVYQFQESLPGNSRSPVEMADNCREFLSAESDKPFFLYFCTSDPHRSGGVGPGPHNPNPFGNTREYPGVEEVTYDPGDVSVPHFLPDTPVCRSEVAQYYQSISRIDQGLGRLVSLLKEAGAYEDTLIIYTSDHGMAFPGGKTTLYEGGMRVPFVVRSPGQKNRGAASGALVSLVDLTPTILDFAGALDPRTGAAREELATAPPGRRRQERRPYHFHGRSVLPAVNTGRSQGFDEVYASHTFHEIQMYYPMRVVRGRRYKLIWNIAHPLPFPFASDLWAAPTWQDRWKQGPDTTYGQRTVSEYIHRPEFELFDLESDPYEAKNLADDPEHAERLAALKDKIKAFQKRTSDGWILKWEYE